jgi:hypothetical protein
LLPSLSESDIESTEISSGLPKVLLDGIESSSASKSALTLFTSALAAGVFPDVMSQRSEFMSLESLAFEGEVSREEEELTAFVLVVF